MNTSSASKNNTISREELIHGTEELNRQNDTMKDGKSPIKPIIGIHELNKKRKQQELNLKWVGNADKAFDRFVHRAAKSLRRMLLFAIVLMVVQYFVPEVPEKLPHVYRLLNEVAIPIVEWFYGVTVNVLHWIANLPIIRNVLEGLANLI